MKTLRPWVCCLVGLLWGLAGPSASAMTVLSDAELGEVTGTGAVDFSVDGSTMRIFIDTTLELFGEIDSLKLGYYYRPDLTTRKVVDPADPKIKNQNGGVTGMIPFDEIPADPFVLKEIEHKCHANELDEVGLYYTDSDEMQFKYKEIEVPLFSDVKGYLEGPAGLNNYKHPLLGTMGGAFTKMGFSDVPTQNQAYWDWDINWENVRLGKSEEEPLRMNGLVIRIEMDESKQHITDLIVGTNDLQGQFYADMLRTTGYLNPKLPAHARMQAHQGKNMAKEFQETPVPIMMKRDSFLYFIEQYRFLETEKQVYLTSNTNHAEVIHELAEIYNDGKADNSLSEHDQTLFDRMKGSDFIKSDGTSLYPDDATYIDTNDLAGVQFGVEDPAMANDSSAMFFRFGLDPNSPTFGVNLVAGYEESVAATFDYTGKTITESLKEDWWDRPEMNGS